MNVRSCKIIIKVADAEADRAILCYRELNLRIQNYFDRFARNAFIKQVLQTYVITSL